MLRKKKIAFAATTLLVAAVTATAAGGALSASGTDHPKKVMPASQQLNGTWMTTVTLSDAPPTVEATFRALDTFLPSGELLVSSSVANPSLRSLAHGAWTRTGNRRFASIFVWFRFDPTGKFVGMQRVRRTINLARSLDAFQSTDVIQIIAPDGSILATLHGTEAGTRIGN